SGNNAEWIRIGKGVGSGGNNGFVQTGGGLVYGGKHFLHAVDTDEAAAGYAFADAPRKVKLGKVGLRGTTGHAIYIEHGSEFIIECNVDDAGLMGGPTAHGVYIGKTFQGDYILRDMNVKDCR